MRANLSLAFGLCLTALFFTGCPSTPGECKSTDDCKGQEKYASDTCVEGHCVECGGDSDCKAGFLCSKDHTCQPKPECSTAADCGAGKLCQNQKCVPGCTSDSGCSGGRCVAGQCKSATGSCNSSADCPAGQSCQNGYCATPAQESGPCQLKRVNFGFNESSLDGTAEATLKEDAECLQKRKIAVTLEGNCDERGTEEYNLHLGERRAASTKKYLQTLGVAAAKMKTISYGKERPANPGHDEAAWAENRRVDFVER